MKKILFIVISITIYGASLMVSPSCSKKDTPAPGTTVTGMNTTPGITFSYDASTKNDNFVLTSNRAQSLATNSLGSYYFIGAKSTGTSSSFSSTTPDFRLFDTNTLSTGTPAPELLSDNTTNATLFGSTTLNYNTARAGQVDSATAPTSTSMPLVTGSTIIFKTVSGQIGLISVVGLNSTSTNNNETTDNAVLAIKIAKQN